MALFDRMKKPSKKSRYKSLKTVRKSRMKLIKFNRRKGCTVIASDYTKCLDCGIVIGLHRFACSKCMMNAEVILGVEHGALISGEPISKNRLAAPIKFESEFMSYSNLVKRMNDGHRYLDVTGRHFKVKAKALD